MLEVGASGYKIEEIESGLRMNIVEVEERCDMIRGNRRE